MICAGGAPSSTSCRAGPARKRRARTSTSPSRVAENSSRWPSAGVASSSCRTTGRNPRSAIWSASSSTLTSMSPSWQWPWPIRSARRPGQATTISVRSRSAVTCGRCGVPPKTVVTVSPTARASGDRTAWTWAASSRVGTSTRPRGRHAIVCPPASLATSGRAKASVLPDPVWARPSMSRPASASGSTAAWIGRGVVMPSSARTATRAAATPRAANVPPGAGRGAGCGPERRDRVVRGWPAGMLTGRSAGRADKKDRLQDSSGRVVEGATSVETISLTERHTTGVPSWLRLSAPSAPLSGYSTPP